jgi:ATP-dependent Lhr-like helicase
VTSFENLHPTIQHHVVNTLGWRELRPLQEASIGPLRQGHHALLLAPTAGGKTEAAMLPILSAMVAEGWTGLSVIYVCPLKALLNNLHARLEHYCGWVGRTCARWHGDVLTAGRNKILAELPDCLLTTPESLEAMLISTRVEHRQVFAGVRAVIIDELHAFAGDDRGWHLLAVLERITRLAGREIQRVGLSATIGNPEALLGWMAGHCRGERTLVQIPPAADAPQPEVQVDFVGDIENAARVIAALHGGEKRLVFCDSRARVEQLAIHLRAAGIATHVSHSSLSADERRRAELAFAEGGNCVIVATSTLELGIDVGDLDKVIQIDAPATVASFLQRLGRTGRRAQATRNCLFLALSDESLLQGIGLLNLWRQGYVEPIVPPTEPLHLFAQQLIALILQERAIGRHDWETWIGRLPAFQGLLRTEVEAILQHLVDVGYIQQDGETWTIGPLAESELGRRHFSELVSVFTSPPLFSVWQGRIHLGSVEENALHASEGKAALIALGGRAWRVTDVSWTKRRLEVVPEPGAAHTHWMGGVRALRFELCQAMREALRSDESYGYLSQRGKIRLKELRAEFSWLKANRSGIRLGGDRAVEWWTYAGRSTNQWISDVAADKLQLHCSGEDLRLRIEGNLDAVHRLVKILAENPAGQPRASVVAAKFSDLLPDEAKARLIAQRAYRAADIRSFVNKVKANMAPRDAQ